MSAIVGSGLAMLKCLVKHSEMACFSCKSALAVSLRWLPTEPKVMVRIYLGVLWISVSESRESDLPSLVVC